MKGCSPSILGQGQGKRAMNKVGEEVSRAGLVVGTTATMPHSIANLNSPQPERQRHQRLPVVAPPPTVPTPACCLRSLRFPPTHLPSSFSPHPSFPARGPSYLLTSLHLLCHRPDPACLLSDPGESAAASRRAHSPSPGPRDSGLSR